MKKSEALKLVSDIYYTLFKTRSNIQESFGQDPEMLRLIQKDIMPALYDGTPGRVRLIEVIQKMKESSDDGNIAPIDIYNLIFLIDQELPQLYLIAELLGFRIPEFELALCAPFEEE